MSKQTKQISGAKATLPAFKEGEGTGIQKITIYSNDDKGKTVSVVKSNMVVEYYESILQDAIRATVTYTDTGNTIDNKSAMEGLPIVGQEAVGFKVADNNEQTLDMLLYVNKVTPLLDDTRKCLVQLELASREFIWNEKVRVNECMKGKISDHVEKLLTDSNYLGPTPEAKQQEGYKEKFKKELIEETANDYNFIGNNKKPYYLINWISRGAVPSSDANPKAKTGKGNSAGFLFYETGEGFNFRSIDGLMNIENNEVKKSYIFNETSDLGTKVGCDIPDGYDGKALSYEVDNKVNVQNKLKMGAYSTRLITLNPFNLEFNVITPNAGTTGADAAGNQKNLKLGGKKLPSLNKEFDKTGKNNEYSRTTYMLLDPGTLPIGKGVGKELSKDGTGQLGEKSEEQNYKPEEVLNQGIMRINQLFALKTTITIPGDFSLHAGDAIYVDAPQLKKDTKNDEVDKQTGGNYIIANLCHYMSAKNTVTKLDLIRDSFGRRPKGGQGGRKSRYSSGVRR